VLYQVLEDRTLVTTSGPLPFPAITVVGATTDEGMLPDPFINRFPLRPVLEPYTQAELAKIAQGNAESLNVRLTWDAARLFARASRGVPRQINNYVPQRRHAGRVIDEPLAREVIEDLNRTPRTG
jgi:Holliday junction DNA helicase RuvB